MAGASNSLEAKASDPTRAMVFQKQALLSWLNVLENTEFGLKLQGVARDERLSRARDYLALVGLSDF